jgi:transcriptional regulator with XRE-family HTH domain
MPRSSRISPEAARFGAIIRRLRLARGWTAVKLAQRAGMNSRYLGVLEQGGNDTTLTTIVELCDVLNADIGEVMREVASVRIRQVAKVQETAEGS